MTAFSNVLSDGRTALLGLFVVTQVIYLGSMLVIAFFYSRPVDLVDPARLPADRASYPPVLLFYPVLRELEETMRTTFYALDSIDYPRDRYRIVAIPNSNDFETIAALERLQLTFPWLEILSVPPTSDPSWNIVWQQWARNTKAYWWHTGKRAGVRDLPPKKTRQLVYAFYNLCPRGAEDTLISYIDADSAPPPNYFLLGAAGASSYDVVQLTNVAGNILASWASSFHGFDHICWDASMYAHMTAHGKHPFYVLGKGLFFRSSDLHAFGGFHPWLTIEDPEVGMRLWTNGRRLGVVTQPLVEEVPRTFRLGVTQRKRWVCGFFQSLGSPLRLMGMTGPQRFRARLNLVPCLALLANPVGLISGAGVLALTLEGRHPIDRPLEILAAVNVIGLLMILCYNWFNAWKVSKLVLTSHRDRLRLAARVNPICTLGYWIFWCVSIVIGLQMFLRDKGLVWERTEKVDANHDLVRESELVGARFSQASAAQPAISPPRHPARTAQPTTSGPHAIRTPLPSRPLGPSRGHSVTSSADRNGASRPVGRHRAGGLSDRRGPRYRVPSGVSLVNGQSESGSEVRSGSEQMQSQLAGLGVLFALAQRGSSSTPRENPNADTLPSWRM
jgi:glycosyltransferase XagB